MARNLDFIPSPEDHQKNSLKPKTQTNWIYIFTRWLCCSMGQTQKLLGYTPKLSVMGTLSKGGNEEEMSGVCIQRQH